MSVSEPDDVIRITAEEAGSEHVDDLIKRQMSLRGDAGVSREGKKRFVYQSWFLLGLVGAVFAFFAWAVIEPRFDDYAYAQGTITDLHMAGPDGESVPIEHRGRMVTVPVQGTVTVNGEKLWVFQLTKELRPDGSKPYLDLARLRVGQTVGVYVEVQADGGRGVALAHYVVPSPRSAASARASLPLAQQHARSSAMGMMLFSIVAGFIGLGLGAADGLICRLPRRALLGGAVGVVVGLIGGFLSGMVGGLVYTPLNMLATNLADGPMGLVSFLVQILGRSLAWAFAGMAMGLGQGIALRSQRLLLFGFLGGVLGGLLGGLLFDPIDMVLLGPDKPSAHWSRLVAIVVIGAAVGALVGVVELLARDAWLRMTAGPLSGKEFLLFRDVMRVGSSPRADLYVFNDPGVAGQHATIRRVGDEVELEAARGAGPVLVNGRPTTTARLRHGDRIALSRTEFVFERRQG